MEWLLISPPVIGNLPILILDLLITLYLISVRRKSVATRWLTTWFFSLTILAFTQIVTSLVYDPLWSFYSNRIAASVTVLFSLIPLIQFAYHFLDNTYPIESEIALYITTIISLGLSIVFTFESLSTNAIIYQFDIFQYETYAHLGIFTNLDTTGKIFNTVLPLGYAWAVIVLLRKTIHFSPKKLLGLISPVTRKSKAARAFAMAILGAVIAVIINRLESASIVPKGSYTSITLLATFATVVIYINNSTEATSFRNKLISISLVALLVSLGVVNSIVISIAEQSYDNEHLAQLHHVQSLFASDSTIGIPPQVAYLTARPNSTGLYPAGYAWLVARVEGLDANNLLTSNTKARALEIEQLQNKMMENDSSLDKGNARFRAASQIDQSIVPLGTRLYRGNYDPISQHFIYYVFEQKGSLYEVGYSYLEYRRYIHGITLQLASLMIAATTLILILFPLFFSNSIIAPLNALLDGVRKVNAGKHDVVVPIYYPDEIGFLADSFNGMVREVADREQSLAKAEEYYRSLIENTSDLISIIEVTGIIRYESPSITRMFGYNADELVGHNVLEFIHPNDQSRVQDSLKTTPTSSLDMPPTAIELRLRHKDGSWHIVESVARNLVDNPNVNGFIINSRDVTERKRVESLQKEKDAAEESNRAKSRFLASMSHELRTPLNAIIGYSEMLTEEAEELGQESLTADLKKIHSSGKSLLGIINDILDFSKIEAGKMPLYLEFFDINTLVLETVQTVQPLVNKNQNRLMAQTLSQPLEMYSDLVKVRQILYNLISNASKFTSNGDIHLEVRHEAASDGENSEEWITLRVSDTGIGLSEEQIGKLFKPFTQADDSTTRKYGGTGLGLAISMQFCQMLGGEISASGEMGKGATFVVRLPLRTKQK